LVRVDRSNTVDRDVEASDMTAAPPDLSPIATPRSAAEPLKLATHVVAGIAIGLVAPFTVLAWPFAILVGIVIGKADTARLRGEPRGAGSAVIQVLAVTGGVLAMLFFGAILGGLLAFVVVALAAFSERAAAHASPTDRIVARILLFVVPVFVWLALIALGFSFELHIGYGS
jgi:hypothetical protein